MRYGYLLIAGALAGLACRSPEKLLEPWRLPVADPPGLLHHDVRAIQKDPESEALWFGTWGGGATRYDPVGKERWTTYTRADGLASNFVEAILPEPGGRALWFATGGGGVSRYDIMDDRWTTYTTNTTDHGLVSDYVHAVQVGPEENELWMGTDRGVSRYDLRSGQWESLTGILSSGNFRAIEFEPGGKAIWFATEGSGVIRYVMGSGGRRFTTIDGLAGSFVYSIEIEPGEGALWFGTRDGVSRYDLADETWTTQTVTDGLVDNEVLTILADSAEDVLWFGTRAGVSRYDLSQRSWATLAPEGVLANVPSLYRDAASGLLWVGTQANGICSYDLAADRWRTLPHAEGLAADEIYAIQTEPGAAALWFGTRGGASRLDLESGHWKSFTSGDGLASEVVQAIQPEPGEAALWFGTEGGGASRYDLKSGRWQRFTAEDGLGSDFVQTLQVEPGEAALWFGTQGHGASRYDLKSHSWQRFTVKDGLGSNFVQTLQAQTLQAEPRKRVLWFGFGSAGGGVSRYTAGAKDVWKSFTVSDGLADDRVFAIEEEPGGNALWFGTAQGGASRYDLRNGKWANYNTDNGLASNYVQAILTEPGGNALWFGTDLGGVSRYDLKSGVWESFDTGDGLPGDKVQVLRFDSQDALWLGTPKDGVVRIPVVRRGGPTDLGSWVHVLPPFRPEPNRLELQGQRLIRSRPAGVVAIDLRQGVPMPTALTNQPLQVAGGPDDRFWVVSRLGGLRLIASDGTEIQMTMTGGLPAMDVHALSAVPGSGGAVVWVATAGGAAKVRFDGKALLCEGSATSEDEFPVGSVDSLAAAGDGSVFLAYAYRAIKRFFGSDLASGRSKTHVRHFFAGGSPGPPIQFPPGYDDVKIRDLAVSPPVRVLGLVPRRPETLWAATSAGLFAAYEPRRPDAEFERVEASGLVAVPLRALEIDPEGNVWAISDVSQDERPVVIGYRPGAREARALSEKDGIPVFQDEDGRPRIDDLAFPADGELVVMAGSRLARGRVELTSGLGWLGWLGITVVLLLVFGVARVFFHPQVRRLRKHPEGLRMLPFPQIPLALRRLRAARALDDVLQSLGLGPERRQTILTLVDSKSRQHQRRLRALGELLGALDASQAEVKTLSRGLLVLFTHLADPRPLRNVLTPLVAFNPEDDLDIDLAIRREELARALDEAGHPFENPLLLLCRDPVQGRAIVPGQRGALLVGEKELRALLFAPSPSQTLSGLLLTRDLLALSPYSTKGPVTNPNMFYGRSRLIRELLQAPSLHLLLVGPRRVGKTSVLRRLADQLRKSRLDLDPVSVDLLAQDQFQRVVRKLAHELRPAGSEAIEPPDGDEADWLAGLLRRRFKDRRGLLLIDEADNLVELDEARGYPLISTLRSLHNEGTCSVILTGYWHLYRRTFEHHSPLNNMADECRLGPLAPDVAKDLATEPMARLGLSWESDELPARLVERTGGYPDLVQAVCDLLLDELKRHRSLDLREENLVAAEEQLRSRLLWSFRINALGAGQLMVDGLLENDAFTGADAHTALEGITGRDVPVSVRDLLLEQLILYGFASKTPKGSYTWALPLLREALLKDLDRADRRSRLLAELPEDPSIWLTLRR